MQYAEIESFNKIHGFKNIAEGNVQFILVTTQFWHGVYLEEATLVQWQVIKYFFGYDITKKINKCIVKKFGWYFLQKFCASKTACK